MMDQQATAKVGRYRYLVVGVVWLILFGGAFDRSNVSLLLVDPGFLKDMELEGSPERQGLVMSMLLLPYAISNILLGPTADRWGPRRVMASMVGLWSVAAVFMGAAWSYPALLAGRITRGLAEGPMFPAANRYVRYWFPSSERGGANAIWTCGQRMGIAVSVPILAAAIALFGWRFSFFLQAALVVAVVLPATWFLTADRPEGMRRVGEGERAHIAGGRAAPKGEPPRWQQALPVLLSDYRFWLAVTYHFSTLAVYAGLLTWLPKYLKDARGFDLAQLVFFATLPYVTSTVTSLGFGFLSDRIGRRSVICAVGLAGGSLAICLAALAAEPVASALWMAVGFASWGAGGPAYYAIMQRIVPGHIMATGIGIDNGLANLGSALAPTAVGFLIGATGGYLVGLLFLAALGAIGSLAAAVLFAHGH